MVLAEDSICTKKMVKQYKEWDKRNIITMKIPKRKG